MNNLNEQIQKLMMSIHSPTLTAEERQSENDEYTINVGDLYAKPILPNGSWKTCDDNLEYLVYNDENDDDGNNNNVSNDDPTYRSMDNNIELTNFEKVFINGIQWDRYCKLGTKTIEVKLDLGEKFTEYTMVRSIKDFYHRNLTDDELSQIAYVTDDGWGYNEKALKVLTKRKKDHGIVLKNYEVMGDCVWFEGLTPSFVNDKTVVYKLLLGS